MTAFATGAFASQPRRACPLFAVNFRNLLVWCWYWTSWQVCKRSQADSGTSPRPIPELSFWTPQPAYWLTMLPRQDCCLLWSSTPSASLSCRSASFNLNRRTIALGSRISTDLILASRLSLSAALLFDLAWGLLRDFRISSLNYLDWVLCLARRARLCWFWRLFRWTGVGSCASWSTCQLLSEWFWQRAHCWSVMGWYLGSSWGMRSWRAPVAHSEKD